MSVVWKGWGLSGLLAACVTLLLASVPAQAQAIVYRPNNYRQQQTLLALQQQQALQQQLALQQFALQQQQLGYLTALQQQQQLQQLNALQQAPVFVPSLQQQIYGGYPVAGYPYR